MAFEASTPNANKNKFVMSLNSRKSDRPTSWVNLIDSFVLNTFPKAKSIKDLTAEEVGAKLTHYYSNEFVYLHVIDTTEERVIITPEEY